MLIDTDAVFEEGLKLIDKYGRRVVLKAEKCAVKDASIYRPLTPSWVQVFLYKREKIAKRLYEKQIKESNNDT